MKESRRLVIYVIALYAASFAVQGYIWLAGGLESSAFQILAPIVMFFPGIAALVYLKISGEGWHFINWRIGKPQYLLYGLLIPAVTALICVVILTTLDIGESPHLQSSAGRVNVYRGLFVLGQGEQSLLFFALNFFVTTVTLGFVNGLVTVGEEIGWRGFMQQKLISRNGLMFGIGLLGLIWAYWHTPIILLGYNYPETPILGALLLWPATCILLSFVFAWLTIKGKSVWPAVLAHGSYNAFHGGLVDGMNFPGGRLIPDLVVLAVWLMIATLAIILTRRHVEEKVVFKNLVQ